MKNVTFCCYRHKVGHIGWVLYCIFGISNIWNKNAVWKKKQLRSVSFRPLSTFKLISQLFHLSLVPLCGRYLHVTFLTLPLYLGFLIVGWFFPLGIFASGIMSLEVQASDLRNSVKSASQKEFKNDLNAISPNCFFKA